MTKPKIAIIGIGGSGSIGFTLSRDIVRDTALMESIDELLLNNGDDSKDTARRDFVNGHIRDILFPLLYAIDREQYLKKIRYASQEEIAEQSAQTVLSYEAKYSRRKGGTIFCEPNNRKKFYKHNFPITKDIAEKFGKRNAQGQCIAVTNPALDIAKAFQKYSKMEDGQVLAFNPDHFRMILKMKSLEDRLPKIKNFYDKVFLAGDHGGTWDIISLDDEFYKLEDEGVNIAKMIQRVMLTGQHVSYRHSGVDGNVVPHLSGFIRATALKRERNRARRFVWGYPYKGGIYCSVPVINELRGERGVMPIYRARIADEFV